MNRRDFSQIGLSGLVATVFNKMPALKFQKAKKLEQVFIHHVFIWLRNPDSQEDLTKLIAGMEKLSEVPTLASFHIGKPSPSDRPVVDGSYSVSWFTTFNSKEDEDAYQIDPIHLEFVDTCNHLWSKVLVYDSIDAI